MNRRSAQAFALGLLLAAVFIWAGNSVIAEKESGRKLTVSDAKRHLEDNGYHVISSSEFSKLTAKEDPVKKEQPSATAGTKAPGSTLQKEQEKAESEKKFTLIIVSGMTPKDVAAMLQSNGIIADAAAFERYLIDNNFHTKIQIGSYVLTNSMDFNQIAKIIT
ncbi:hypothetical protein [Mesobacillus stamsii]|uniref:Septal ring-binding cell division protein DamX n=1 Tax=Mesobacillus stamsii TaxID=225347 RepID=A0ABU0G0U0_9BACI|nr:hypothetical protein [Mesobacillus stamsii]MDQ0415813.1 septal ring-binding cell division protein DamX [Mesobacillus stamsii]